MFGFRTSQSAVPRRSGAAGDLGNPFGHPRADIIAARTLVIGVGSAPGRLLPACSVDVEARGVHVRVLLRVAGQPWRPKPVQRVVVGPREVWMRGCD